MPIDTFFENVNNFTEHFLVNVGIPQEIAHIVNVLLLSILVAALAITANFIAKKIIIKIIKRWVDKSQNAYDDIFYEKGVFNKLSHLAPAIIIAYLAPIPLNDFKSLISIIITLTNVYVLVIVLMVVFSVIDALHVIYESSHIGKQRSIKGYIQVVKSILYFLGTLMLISILFNKNLSSLFAGLTAFAAVLLFVFKDALLGLIAGIQISSNDLLRVGDYIEIPNKGIEGTVIDIKLSLVKIQNTNKTISTLPVYFFVSESYMNWRGLQDSEGRRLRRYISLNMHTIKFCSIELFNKLKKQNYIPTEISFDSQLTNAKLFRLYLENYLRNSNHFVLNTTFIVRYLQPNENGLPLEIYAYTIEKDFTKFEKIQSELFEYIIALATEFELKIYQRATDCICNV